MSTSKIEPTFTVQLTASEVATLVIALSESVYTLNCMASKKRTLGYHRKKFNLNNMLDKLIDVVPPLMTFEIEKVNP